MSRPRLSLAIIAKDEEENLRNCLASVYRFVDEIVVVDTGSTDGTRAVATQFSASVIDFSPRTHPDAFFLDDADTCKRFGYDIPGSYSGEMAFADFAAARNVSFEHCTGDFILWVDADDVVEGAEFLPKIVEDLAARGLNLGFFPYDYARDHLGRVFYRQWRERVIRRGIGRWVNDVHEVFMPNVIGTMPVKYSEVKTSHRRKADRKGLPNRNYKLLLRMLAREHARNPGVSPDPRTLFYLGQEARFLEPKRAIGFYETYLKVSGWGEERAAAHAALGMLYEFGAAPVDAAEAYNRANKEYAAAAAEMPDNPDGLFGMARIAHLRGRWADCVSFTERAFAIGNTDSMLGANPLDRLYRPHVYLNKALAELGRIEEAAESCRKGLAVCPDDPGVPGGAPGMLIHNLKFYEARIAEMKTAAPPPSKEPLVEFDKNENVDTPPAASIPRDALVIWSMQLWKQVIAEGNPQKARLLLDALPEAVKTDAAFARMFASTEMRLGRVQLGPAREVALGPPLVPAPRSALQALVDGGLAPAPELVARAAEVKQSFDAIAAQLGTRPRVVFFVGPAFQPWDPTTPEKTGIGGSETAVVEMARELTRRGCSVQVYGDLGKAGHVARFDLNNQECGPYSDRGGAVEYINYDAFKNIDCDVFISSRNASVADVPVRAKLKLLWVHDIHVGPPMAAMERWLLAFDRVLCLSQWHKDFFLGCYPTLHPDRVIVTRNGIDPSRFAARQPGDLRALMGEQVRKRGNRLIYSSSPNRGLDVLLANMPFIRARVPDAQLDICYGFESWEAFAQMRAGAPDPNISREGRVELDVIAGYKAMIAKAVAEGVAVYHGRVPQSKLAQLMLEAKVWAYPTSFLETSCITAMEAQAAGAVPVASKIAALPETVQHGFLVEPGPRYGEQWVEAVVGMLTNEEARSKIAAAGRAWALDNLSWASLADGWLAMLERLSAEVERNPVPLWKEVG